MVVLLFSKNIILYPQRVQLQFNFIFLHNSLALSRSLNHHQYTIISINHYCHYYYDCEMNFLFFLLSRTHSYTWGLFFIYEFHRVFVRKKIILTKRATDNMRRFFFIFLDDKVGIFRVNSVKFSFLNQAKLFIFSSK